MVTLTAYLGWLVVSYHDPNPVWRLLVGLNAVYHVYRSRQQVSQTVAGCLQGVYGYHKGLSWLKIIGQLLNADRPMEMLVRAGRGLDNDDHGVAESVLAALLVSNL